MHILVVNGQKVQLARHEVPLLMRHKYFVGYFLSGLALMMALNPFAGFFTMDVMTTTLLFTQGAVVYLLVYFGGALLLDRWNLWTTTLILWPAASFCTATSVVLIGQVLDLGHVSVMELAILYTFHLTVFFVGELAFVSFLLDACLKDIRAKAMADPPSSDLAPTPVKSHLPHNTAPENLYLFGHRFDLAELWAIRAVEHYIEVKTKAGEYLLLRGRMSEAEGALPEGLGMRVHRSHWVAAQALKALDQRPDRWQLSLHCGTEIPVARARREETREWVSKVLSDQS
jgi:hypothetical protein